MHAVCTPTKIVHDFVVLNICPTARKYLFLKMGPIFAGQRVNNAHTKKEGRGEANKKLSCEAGQQNVDATIAMAAESRESPQRGAEGNQAVNLSPIGD